ncbi:MAG TPA: hypothetical protein VLC94_04460 [Candidatus Acidoferrum sp.]|nr:hypothetical protein [Candidatus Acidoferrum sp.]
MTADSARTGSSQSVLTSTMQFLRGHAGAVAALSALLLIPCFWHRHIQAGDLGSHVYNAWLAQLVERNQVTGLVVAEQWNNVLFDWLVLHLANHAGFVAAERMAVSAGVLIFFWGSFAFLSRVNGRAAWRATPFLFVLGYGYAFHMGFMNYYFSIGLALLALAASWRGGAKNWLLAGAIAALALVAHPIGFVLFACVAAYVLLWRVLPRWPRAGLVVAAAVFFGGLRFYFERHEELAPSWREEGFLQLLGQDQMNVYGHRYGVLAWFALGWGVVCAAAAVYDWIFRGRKPAAGLRLILEIYVIALIATFCLPENFRTHLYAGWIGLLVSRLTLVTAVFGLAGLAALAVPRWTWRGAAVIAAVFALFLYQDTGKLDRMETNARALTSAMAPATRIVAVANAPADWRVSFIYHSIDRACIGHCFSYANYEASSQQFRLRAAPGNYVVTTSVDQSDDMSSGDYVVRKKDLPLISIYQCDDAEFTTLCARELKEGQKTEDPEGEAVAVPDEEE